MLFFRKKSKEKPDFSGGEGKLYIKGDKLYKYYFKPENYDYSKIIELKKRQAQIELTAMPLDGIFRIDEFVGVILKYFEGSQSLSYLYDIPIEYKMDLVNQTDERLKELTDNNIYLKDLHKANIIVPRDGIVQLIDIDSIHTEVSDKPNFKILQEVLRKYRSVLISYLYNEEFLEADIYGEDLARKLEIDESVIRSLFKEELSYEVLKEFIDYTVKSKKYIKRR